LTTKNIVKDLPNDFIKKYNVKIIKEDEIEICISKKYTINELFNDLN
jgi:hypothetical protein